MKINVDVREATHVARTIIWKGGVKVNVKTVRQTDVDFLKFV